MKAIISGVAILIALGSCQPHQWIVKSMKKNDSQLQHHVGFYLFDPETREVLADFQGDRYFAPASNTKILTLFASIRILGDSIEALKYITRQDSTIIWGTADPSFLYPKVSQNEQPYAFLKNAPGQLFFSTSNWVDTEHFGPGWAWDDYQYSFSPERSPFPLYGNLITLDRFEKSWKATPDYFTQHITQGEPVSGREQLLRHPADNQVVYHSGDRKLSSPVNMPYHWSPTLTTTLLSDTLGRAVTIIDLPIPKEAKTLHSIPVDSVYAEMMQESDNFIAEQLLLQCAQKVSDTLRTEIAIQYVRDNYFNDLPDSIRWVDGSGLSRYNLLTPRTLVSIWDKIDHLVPRERLWQWLAVGGVSGTTKNYYVGDPPYIYAKTGTLSNNHCLSGYLITQQGKVLLFSFMNSNYTLSTNAVKAYMEKTLRSIHEKY